MTEQSAATVRADLFCGAGIGLLVGVLVGLSVSEVVAAILTGLTTLLAATLGLVSAGEKIGGRPWRIGAFGLCAALAVLIGVYLRTHDLLAPSPARQLATWKQIVPPARAAELVVYHELGIVPASATIQPRDQRGERSVLYAAPAETCSDLDPSRFDDPRERLHAWQLQGGHWREIALAAGRLPDADGASVLIASWRLACDDRQP